MDTVTFLSLLAACSACISSTLVWTPQARDMLKTSLLPLPAAWCLFSAYSPLHQTWDFGIRSINGSLLGALVAFVLSPLSRVWRFVLSFPFVFVMGMAEKGINAPVRPAIFNGSGLLTLYIVLGWGPDDPIKCGKLACEALLCFVIPCCVTTTMHMVITAAVGRSESRSSTNVKKLLQTCLSDMTQTTGGLMAYLKTGDLHQQELLRRVANLQSDVASFKDAVSVLQREPWWGKNAQLNSLTALHEALSDATTRLVSLISTLEPGYSPDCLRVLWTPVAHELDDLRLAAVAALQHLASAVAGEMSVGEAAAAAAAAEEKAAKLRSAFQDVSLRTAAACWEQTGGISIEAAEAMRTIYVFLSLQQFPGYVTTIHGALADLDLSEFTWSRALGFNCLCNIAVCWCQRARVLCDRRKYFPPSPADCINTPGGRPLTWCQRMRRDLRQPFRFAVVNHLAASLLVLLAAHDTAASPYAFWALLPCCLCFLPTAGATVKKAIQRMAGTVTGGALAFASLYISAGNRQALFSQLFNVCYLSSYVCLKGPLPGYGGLIIGVTWCIVALGGVELNNPYEFNEVPIWRIAMTGMGVLFVLAASFLVLPIHATRLYEAHVRDALQCGTEACVSSLRFFIQEVFAPPNPAADENAPATPSIASRDELASARRNIDLMKLSLAAAKDMLAVAHSERPLVKPFLDGLDRLQSLVEKFANSAAVCVHMVSKASAIAQAGAPKFCLTSFDASLRLRFEHCFEAWGRSKSYLDLLLQGRSLPAEWATEFRGPVPAEDEEAKKPVPELDEAKDCFYESFRAVRTAAFAQGKLPVFSSRGLVEFWALVYSFDEFMDTCVQLDHFARGLENNMGPEPSSFGVARSQSSRPDE